MTKEASASEISRNTVQRIVREWKGVLSCVGLGTALYIQRAEDIHRLDENFKALSDRADRYYTELRDRGRVGPGGFLDPQIQAGLEAYLRSYLRDHGKEFEAETRRWRKQLSALNPAMKMPEE